MAAQDRTLAEKRDLLSVMEAERRGVEEEMDQLYHLYLAGGISP